MIARRLFGGRNPGGRPVRRPVEAEIPEASSRKAATVRPGGAEGEPVGARGVIRLEQVYPLTRYRTVYGPYDYPTAGHDRAPKSDV